MAVDGLHVCKLERLKKLIDAYVLLHILSVHRKMG